MGNWEYVGKKTITCPNCHKDIELEARIRVKK